MKTYSTNEIYSDLYEQLINAVIPAGSKIKPVELQSKYGCSTNTIRDTLLRLSKIGLVTFQMQRGFRARETSPEKRSDIAKFRVLLEQEGAALSIRKAGLDWEIRLNTAHHKLTHIEKLMTKHGLTNEHLLVWSSAEFEFHDALISGCASDILIETYGHIYAQFRQQFVAQERDFGVNYFESIIHEHATILQAALARNEEACKQAIYDHMKRNF